MRSYFMGYDVTNLYDQPVVLRWSEGAQQQGQSGGERSLVIPPHGSAYYDARMVSSVQPRDVTVRAYLQGSSPQKQVPIHGRTGGYKLSWSHSLGRYFLLIGNQGE